VLISLTLLVSALVTLWWTMHAWRTPETLLSTRFPATDRRNALSFSLLVPARHEEAVLQRTVERLLDCPYPFFEVLVIVGHDDPGTAAVAHRLAERDPERVKVVVDTNAVKNKPRALNTALPQATGDVVGVFDAEDQVHPDLLAHVDHAFRASGAAVVQGGVQLINFHSSWYSLRNCLEYFFWFRSRLHLHAEKGFIPLGGNTVFIKTETLREFNGWDGDCLAEDCDLGVRLSSQRKKVVVAYDASMVTKEETPDTLMALYKQRTRWNQGFLQVLRKKDWKHLPNRRQRLLACYTLTSPFLQAFTGVTIPLGIAIAVLFDLPVAVALFTFLPLLPFLASVAFEIAGLHDFGQQYDLRIRWWHYVKLIVGAPPYMVLLAAAAIRAVWREQRGRTNWELTKHVGAHLGADNATPAVSEATA
jgi:cellulose synthase/poly-beta-1,6-N-acetylglucosamine synthase-like glycosyltransferase